MKNLLFALLICASSYAQRSMSFQLTQDVKLATMKDDFGNEPFTLDATFKWKWQGDQIESRENPFFKGFLSIGGTLEVAQIDGDYYRYSAEVGYTLNNLCTPEILFIPSFDMEVTPFINYGFIDRYGKSFSSFEAGIDFAFPLDKRKLHKIHLLNSWTQRNDLGWLWGETKIRYNFSAGYSFNLPL
jgi:hypothetical protein